MSEDEQKKRLVAHLYDSLLNAANRFLHQARNYSISVLRLENPTYAEIAGHFRDVAELIDFLARQIDDALTGDKAKEYIACMEGIARAIDDDDSDALEKYVQHLEKRPFL